MYLAKFIAADNPQKDLERHESRLALALEIDQATRVLDISNPEPPGDLSPASPHYGKQSPFTWKDNTWARAESAARKQISLLSYIAINPVYATQTSL